MVLEEAFGGVEDNSGGKTIVEDVEYNEIGPSSNWNERVDEMNAPRRKNRPGGHMVEPEALKGVEGDRRCESDGKRILIHGKWSRKDGATSDTRRESKRLETRSLAEDESSQ